MKCISCGAQLGLDEVKCPYCDADNSIAIKRKGHIEKLKKQNEEYENEVVEKSRSVIWHKIHKRINLGLFIFIVLVVALAYLIIYVDEKMFGPERLETVKTYYENGEYLEALSYEYREELYIEYGHEDYYIQEYLNFWSEYNECMENFATFYQAQQSGETLDRWKLQNLIGKAYYVLKPHREDEMFEPYREHVKMILLGYMQIPQEMLDDLFEEGSSSLDEIEELTDYVSEVFGIEE